MKLIEEELTYRIIGLMYSAVNQLGYGFQERYYQRAFAGVLAAAGIPFLEEQSYPVKLLDGKTIVGRYQLDFVVADKIIVEWKVGNEFYESHINQVLAYLKTSHYRVAIIGLVTP